MPPVHVSAEDASASAFTVINHEPRPAAVTAVVAAAAEAAQLPRNVNVVKPLQHDEARSHLTSAPEEDLNDRMAAPLVPNSILDPKFSRALDFKLRRLKEKEVLQANLRRPTRYRPRNGFLAASNPNISLKDQTAQGKSMSQSHPRIDIEPPPPDCDKSKMDASPSPGRRSRVRYTSQASEDKPRFVTTVRSGQFLLPPPEVACLLGLEALYPPQERDRIVYSYASKPKAVAVATRSKRSLAERKDEYPSKRAHGAAGALAGVRALVAGVVGMRHLLDKQDTGSVVAAAGGHYSNVMHDKRVVRGSTFGSHPLGAGDGSSPAALAARTRRRALARRAAARARPATPPPAPGRRHHPIQTEYYLEELFDKGVEMEVGVQTDLFADRPATPVYVPAKTGADAFTQIYPGDLFDFDVEVQPILEVLVGKTTEQALAEVAQEEELGALREQQRRYRELRDAELAERQRLAAAEVRLVREKERRVGEARGAQAAAREARDRAAAAVLVRGYAAELLPAVLAGLRDQGYLVERTARGVHEEVVPWLARAVCEEIEALAASRDLVTQAVRDVVAARADLYRAAALREEAAAVAAPPDEHTPPSEPLGEEEEEALEEE